jgi:hypothetical protein
MLEATAQHPGHLVANFQALRQKISRWRVVGSGNDREQHACRAVTADDADVDRRGFGLLAVHA